MTTDKYLILRRVTRVHLRQVSVQDSHPSLSSSSRLPHLQSYSAATTCMKCCDCAGHLWLCSDGGRRESARSALMRVSGSRAHALLSLTPTASSTLPTHSHSITRSHSAGSFSDSFARSGRRLQYCHRRGIRDYILAAGRRATH